MRGVRHVPFFLCALLVACGGKIVSTDNTRSVTGSGGGGVTPTNPGDMMDMPGISQPGDPGMVSGGATPCGNATCGPGLYCCNPSCGVCALPAQGCDAIACGVPISDAGPVAPIDPRSPLPGGLSDYGNPLQSSWFVHGCQTKAGHDCIEINNCPNGGAPNFEDRGSVATELFPIGGTNGVMYVVTFQVNGISEAKYYQGGTRDQGEAIPLNADFADLDLFYRGGTPVISNYGVLRMRILDAAKKELARYYLNSAPPSSGMESHRTFHLSYSKTIDVPAGGFVEYLTQDSNCHSIDNCGDANVSDTVCSAARGIPHEEANPLPKTAIDPDPSHDINGVHRSVAIGTLNSVNGDTKPWHSQIVHVTITKAVAK